MQEKITILDTSGVEGMQLMRAHYRNQSFRRHSEQMIRAGLDLSDITTSIVISVRSLQEAAAAVAAKQITNVTFAHQNIYELDFADESFDHLFCCFVLEYLADPEFALTRLNRVLKPGGTIKVIEGDHGSFFKEDIYSHGRRNPG